MIPFWKMKREARRIGRQSVELIPRLKEYFFATPYDDIVLSRRRILTPGAIQPGSKVAIYVIFPTHGVLASHLEALKHLTAKGWSPLVVSNLFLSDDDRERLREYSFHIIERVNHGYDFGGYRTAVRWLRPQLATLDRLVLMNDSTWFPAPGAEDWLGSAETMDLDFVGALAHFAVEYVDLQNYNDIRWDFSRPRRDFHYTSYALMIGPAVLRDPAFTRFFSRMILTDDKVKVVARGEIGLTRFIVESGYSHGATYDIQDLAMELSLLDHQRLVEILQRMIIFNDGENETVLDALVQTNLSREELQRLILAVTARQGAGYALPHYLIPEHGFAFLKKSPLTGKPNTVALSLFLISELTGSGADMIRQEASMIVRTWLDRQVDSAEVDVVRRALVALDEGRRIDLKDVRALPPVRD